MLMWKLRSYFVALIALIATINTPILDPLKELFLAQYDVRWYSEDNETDRTTTFRVSNNGASQRQILIDLGDVPVHGIADVMSSPSPEEPKVSLLKLASEAHNLWSIAPRNANVGALTDAHWVAPGLYELENLLTEKLRQDLRATALDGKTTLSFSKMPKTHLKWLIGCPKQFSETECKREQLIENWERSMLLLQTELDNAFLSATGVRVRSSSGYLSLEGRPTFHFVIEPGETKSLTVRFGSMALKSRAAVFRGTKEALHVRSSDDLGANRWVVIPKAQPLETLIAVLVLLVLLWMVWKQATVPESVATFEVFNHALKTKHSRWWDICYKRRGEWILREFKQWCAVFRKDAINVDSSRLFEFVKNRLLLDHELYDLDFEDRSDFEKTIRRHLRELAIKA